MNKNLHTQLLIEEQEQATQVKNAKILAIISLILWITSLGLTGLTVGSHSKRGGEILFSGVLFGWLSPALWTVYSNLPYIYAQFKFLIKKNVPKFSVILMMFLGGLLIIDFFIDVPILLDESGSTGSVSSWGWGAVILLISQSLLAIATLLLHYKITVKVISFLIGILMSMAIGVGAYGGWQRQYANGWEYETYFSPKGNKSDSFSPFEIAFTKIPLSGLPYVPLTEKLPPNATIELELLTDIPSFIPEYGYLYPNAFWQNGKYWRRDPNSMYAKTEYIEYNKLNVTQPSYVFRVTKPKENYLLCTLYDLKDNKILYQQPFMITKRDGIGALYPSDYVIPQEIRFIDQSIKD